MARTSLVVFRTVGKPGGRNLRRCSYEKKQNREDGHDDTVMDDGGSITNKRGSLGLQLDGERAS